MKQSNQESKDEEILKNAFLESLSAKERKSYEIAKSHLGMSFELTKSVGFIEWKKKEKKGKCL